MAKLRKLLKTEVGLVVDNGGRKAAKEEREGM
jgi:hypothetical protein